jgi:hypothetical protein
MQRGRGMTSPKRVLASITVGWPGRPGRLQGEGSKTDDAIRVLETVSLHIRGMSARVEKTGEDEGS